MKRFSIIVIIAALFFQCMAHYFVLALYEIQKEYVATYLCEQKDRAGNVCCGKCYLQKQIVKVNPAPQSDKEGLRKVEKPEFSVYIIPSGRTEFRARDFPDATQIPGLRRLRDEARAASIFHPPSC